MKRSCRQDKRDWIDKKGAPIEDKAGKPLLKKEDQEKSWIEHFGETLNQPDPTITYDASTLTPPEADLPVDLGPISEDETKIAIGLLKNGKAAGLDEVAPEMLKCGGANITHALTSLMNDCWSKLVVLED